jgi:hypothetical protein
MISGEAISGAVHIYHLTRVRWVLAAPQWPLSRGRVAKAERSTRAETLRFLYDLPHSRVRPAVAFANLLSYTDALPPLGGGEAVESNGAVY